MNTSNEEQYLDLLRHVLAYGHEREDRTGVGTRGVFGYLMRFDLRDSFPLLTTKRVFWRGVVAELLWFLRGSVDVRELQAEGVYIWDAWMRPDGTIGDGYGKQWRSFGGVDQIAVLVDGLRRDPYSRRHIVSAWNPPALPDMALVPCHVLAQFYVHDGELSCQLYQRSGDVFLGVPFNIASYSLLTLMLAQVTGLKPGEFVHVLGDAHLYRNHIAQAEEQLRRDPRAPPTVRLDPVGDIFALLAEHIHLEGYDPHPAIKAEVAV